MKQSILQTGWAIVIYTGVGKNKLNKLIMKKMLYVFGDTNILISSRGHRNYQLGIHLKICVGP